MKKRKGDDRNRGEDGSKSRAPQTAKILQEKINDGLEVTEGSKDTHLPSGCLTTWSLEEKPALDS